MFRTPHLNPLEWLSAIVLIIGGLNWALVGLFEYDLVAEIFGDIRHNERDHPHDLHHRRGGGALHAVWSAPHGGHDHPRAAGTQRLGHAQRRPRQPVAEP